MFRLILLCNLVSAVLLQHSHANAMPSTHSTVMQKHRLHQSCYCTVIQRHRLQHSCCSTVRQSQRVACLEGLIPAWDLADETSSHGNQERVAWETPDTSTGPLGEASLCTGCRESTAKHEHLFRLSVARMCALGPNLALRRHQQYLRTPGCTL